MPVSYTKIYKDGDWKKVESDRVWRFLELGWSAQEEKSPSKGSKNKITASAEVTSNVVEDTAEICPDCKEEEPCDCPEPWDPLSGESWADSEESMSVEDDELPTNEEK